MRGRHPQREGTSLLIYYEKRERAGGARGQEALGAEPHRQGGAVTGRSYLVCGWSRRRTTDHCSMQFGVEYERSLENNPTRFFHVGLLSTQETSPKPDPNLSGQCIHTHTTQPLLTNHEVRNVWVNTTRSVLIYSTSADSTSASSAPWASLE